MKKKTILLCCALLCMTLLCACKSEEQIAQTAQPQSTVISPDVHITQEASERETLTVSGEGEVKLTPDLATVSIVIKTTQKQAEDAQPNRRHPFGGRIQLRQIPGRTCGILYAKYLVHYGA